jgi:hypothetical protein
MGNGKRQSVGFVFDWCDRQGGFEAIWSVEIGREKFRYI